MKPSRFTLCCRFFYLSLVGLWEIIVIKLLLFYSEPLSPFISKISCLPLSSKSAAGLSVFFLSPILVSEGENRHLAELLQPLVGNCCYTGLPSHSYMIVAYPGSAWCLKKSQTLSSLLTTRVVTASLKRFQWPEVEFLRWIGLHLTW